MVDKKTYSPKTELVRAGRNIKEDKGAVNPPIYQTSTILFDRWEDYEAACNGERPHEGYKSIDPSYGLSGTPTTARLQETLAELEGGKVCVLSSSGLSAITSTLLACLKAGDHLLVVDTVYGPTRRFCKNTLKKYGIETTFYDPYIGAGIAELIKENTAMVYMEAPGSLTFEMQDVPAIVSAVKATKADVLTAFDNSWATPLYFKPLKLGVDISIHAVTKYISGHSDIVMGAVVANERTADSVKKGFLDLGNCTTPTAAYYALRGIRTLDARLKQHEANTNELISWLEEQDIVEKIINPAHSSHEDYEIWQRDFSGATSLFTIQLNKKYAKEVVVKTLNELDIFGIGASWGGFESLVMYFDPKTIRSDSSRYADATYLRLFIGLEDAKDLIVDLENAFKQLK